MFVDREFLQRLALDTRNSIDSSPRHRHNAEYPQSEATIHYRFYPYAGMALPVTACKVHRDVVVSRSGLNYEKPLYYIMRRNPIANRVVF
jgi:hypothetical protein